MAGAPLEVTRTPLEGATGVDGMWWCALGVGDGAGEERHHCGVVS
jgi:hypothetical protein